MWERLRKVTHKKIDNSVPEGERPSTLDLASYFTVNLLGRLGVESNAYMLENPDVYGSFQRSFTAHILDAVVPRASFAPGCILDGRIYQLSSQYYERLTPAYTHPYSKDRKERTIDVEAGLIIKTMVVPNLQKAGTASLFGEDFLHYVTGEPRLSYSFVDLPELQRGVSYRVSQLQRALEELKASTQIPS